MITKYTKNFESHETFTRELSGYEFVKDYFENVPQIIEVSSRKDIYSIDFVRVDIPPITILTKALDQNFYTDLSKLFSEFAICSNNNLKVGSAEGGTKLFYLDRIGRINSKLLDKDLVVKTLDSIRCFDHGYVVPSQGDFHERNISTNGYLLDFEGGGWNLLSTDIATFLWHSLFVGNYFGPKYAKWSTSVDKKMIKDTPSAIILKDGLVSLNLNEARFRLISDYINLYLNQLNIDLNLIQRDICIAIAFRLLTVFQLEAMSPNDQKITRLLVNSFTNPKSDLNQILQTLTKNLPNIDYTHNQ